MVGFLLSTGVSLMMNGMCCVYQMHGEKELRMAMRQDIRDEWKLQRQLEIQWQNEQRQRLQEEQELLVLAEQQLRMQSMKQRYHLLHNEQDEEKVVVQTKYSPKDLEKFPSFPSLMDDEDDDEDDEEMDC